MLEGLLYRNKVSGEEYTYTRSFLLAGVHFFLNQAGDEVCFSSIDVHTKLERIDEN